MPDAPAVMTMPDFAYKMAETAIGLGANEAVRIKLNSQRFSLFRTCYLTKNLDVAKSLFVSSFVIPNLDWVSIRCYYQNVGLTPSDMKIRPVQNFPDKVREDYLKAVEDTWTVVPYYTAKHEGCVEEAQDRMKFNTAIHQHFRERRVLMEASTWFRQQQEQLLEIIFAQTAKMKIVVNGELHDSVCRFCENYFRSVAGMCHFRKSEKDGTLGKDNQGRLLCSMKLIYNSELDDMPSAVPAPYQVNLLQELSKVDPVQ